MPQTKTASKSIYSVHPSVRMVQDWVAGLKEKTGRDFDEWLSFIKSEGPSSGKDRRTWLKEVHGLGTNLAWWLAEQAEGKGTFENDPEAYLEAAGQYVERMYAGPKSALRPIHDRIIK